MAALAALAVLAGPIVAAAQEPPPPGVSPALSPDGAIDEQVWRAPVAPGVSLFAVRRLDGQGWVDLFALVVDLDTPGVGVDVLTAPTLTERQPISQLAAQAGAVGAINGDFFHLGTSGAPAGIVVKSGKPWKSPYPGGRPSVAVTRTSEGLRAYIARFRLEAVLTVMEPSTGRAPEQAGQPPRPATLQVAAFNEPSLTPGQVGAFDERWGSAPLPLARWSPDQVAFARLAQVPGEPGRWTVTRMGRGVPATGPGPGEMVLLGWREGADALTGRLSPGVVCAWETAVTPDEVASLPAWAAGKLVWAAISGGSLLLSAGRPVVDARQPGEPFTRHPRSAAGVGRDGRRLILVTVDGRRATSRGADVVELVMWLQRLGATDAINLDGGGSATLAALTGPGKLSVVNQPSGGQERAVPVGLGVFFEPGLSTGPGAFVLKPAAGQTGPALDGYHLGAGGLVAAAGTPARITSFPPVEPASLLWTVDPPDLGFFPEPGAFVGLRSGKGRVIALQANGAPAWSSSESLFRDAANGDPVVELARALPQIQVAAAALPVEVIGRPVVLEVTPSLIRLTSGQPVQLHAWLVDADGRRAPIDPDDVTFWLRGGAEGWVRDGQLTARPFRSADPPVLEARYLQLRAEVAIEWAEQTPTGGPIRPPAITPAAPEHPPGATGQPPANGGPPASAGNARVAVLGSLPPAELEGVLNSWLAASSPDLVLAVGRPPVPAEPLLPSAASLLRSRLPVAVAVSDPATQPDAVELVQRLGSANSVATRASSRFLILAPWAARWDWVADQLRRAKSERIRRLFVLTPTSPLAWPQKQEGQMLVRWLSLASREGVETWVLFGDETLTHRLVDGVHLMGVPPVSPSGGLVLLSLAPSGVSVRPVEPAAQLGAPAPAAGLQTAAQELEPSGTNPNPNL